VVVLRLLEDEPVHRIADMLGITQVTVRYHLAQGRRKLALSLGVKERLESPGKEGS
jgi:DNA-directed RNA polymerase specialized sigma24 family protein